LSKKLVKLCQQVNWQLSAKIRVKS
jgi:hypothetical protein